MVDIVGEHWILDGRWFKVAGKKIWLGRGLMADCKKHFDAQSKLTSFDAKNTSEAKA